MKKIALIMSLLIFSSFYLQASDRKETQPTNSVTESMLDFIDYVSKAGRIYLLLDDCITDEEMQDDNITLKNLRKRVVVEMKKIDSDSNKNQAIMASLYKEVEAFEMSVNEKYARDAKAKNSIELLMQELSVMTSKTTEKETDIEFDTIMQDLEIRLSNLYK